MTALKRRQRQGITEAKNRYPVSFRVSDALRHKLSLSARASGRNLSAEIEVLLELALAEQQPAPRAWMHAYGMSAAAILFLAAEAGREWGEDWPLDYGATAGVRLKLDQILGLLQGYDVPAHPHSPAYRLLWRFFGSKPRPADARVAEWLKDCLGEAATARLTPQEGAHYDD
jgi:hypothetical protein